MAKVSTLILIGALVLFTTAFTDDQPYGSLRLLDGYKYKRTQSTDTIGGMIYKDDGLTIEFESGVSQGYAADPRQRATYIWFREQVVNGHRVFVALGEVGKATRWTPQRPRKKKSRHVLIVTFPGNFGPNDAANFYAEVIDEKDVTDTLLMVLTFDPTK